MGQLRTANNRRNRAIRHAAARTRVPASENLKSEEGTAAKLDAASAKPVS